MEKSIVILRVRGGEYPVKHQITNKKSSIFNAQNIKQGFFIVNDLEYCESLAKYLQYIQNDKVFSQTNDFCDILPYAEYFDSTDIINEIQKNLNTAKHLDLLNSFVAQVKKGIYSRTLLGFISKSLKGIHTLDSFKSLPPSIIYLILSYPLCVQLTNDENDSIILESFSKYPHESNMLLDLISPASSKRDRILEKAGIMKAKQLVSIPIVSTGYSYDEITKEFKEIEAELNLIGTSNLSYYNPDRLIESLQQLLKKLQDEQTLIHEGLSHQKEFLENYPYEEKTNRIKDLDSYLCEIRTKKQLLGQKLEEIKMEVQMLTDAVLGISKQIQLSDQEIIDLDKESNKIYDQTHDIEQEKIQKEQLITERKLIVSKLSKELSQSTDMKIELKTQIDEYNENKFDTSPLHNHLENLYQTRNKLIISLKMMTQSANELDLMIQQGLK